MKRNKGSITIEAALILCVFLAGYAAVVSITGFIRAQMLIQYSITEAAKEISSYCYLLSKTSILKDTATINSNAQGHKEGITQEVQMTREDINKVIDATGKLLGSVKDSETSVQNTIHSESLNELAQNVISVQSNASTTVANASSVKEAAEHLYNDFKDSSYLSNPTALLKALSVVAVDEAGRLGRSAIAAAVSRSLVEKQLAAYGDNEDILEKLGVIAGVEGLDFTGCSLFDDGDTILVRVSYDVTVPFASYLGITKELHFTQRAATRAWGAASQAEHVWRK